MHRDILPYPIPRHKYSLSKLGSASAGDVSLQTRLRHGSLPSIQNAQASSSSVIQIPNIFTSSSMFRFHPPPDVRMRYQTEIASISPLISSTAQNGICIMQLRFLSNWGHPSLLTLSSISLYDVNRKKIPILECELFFSSIVGSDYYSLFDHELVKGSPKNLFTLKWPPINKNYAVLAIKVSEDDKIAGIRLWNSLAVPNAGLKDFELYLGKEFLLKDQVSPDFGFNHFSKKLHIFSASSVTQEVYRDILGKDNLPLISDIYGNYPIFSTKTLRVQILINFNNDSRIGLNGLDIYDQEEHVLEWDDIENVNLVNCLHAERIEALFRRDKNSNKFDQMFIADIRDWRFIPEIIITFKQKIRISKIMVWNFNGNNPSVRSGIRAMRLRDENRLIWSGLLPMASGLDPLLPSDSKLITFLDLPSSLIGTPAKLEQEAIQEAINFQNQMKNPKIDETTDEN